MRGPVRTTPRVMASETTTPTWNKGWGGYVPVGLRWPNLSAFRISRAPYPDITKPPSTGRTAPVMKAASSEARKATA